jgi:uncharacterized protein (TIGR04255 family)
VGEKLRNAPLVHVLADVQFSQVFGLEERVVRLQAAFKELGFPWVQEGMIQQVTAVAGSPPEVTLRRRYDFRGAERTTAIALTESAIALHTTAYTHDEPFLSQVGSVLSGFLEVVDPPLVERIGIRYLDRIASSRDVPLDHLVVPGMLGFLGAPVLMGSELLGMRTETVSRTADGILAVRSGVLGPNQIVPWDLQPGMLVYPKRADHAESALFLDFDHYVQLGAEAFPMAADPVLEHLKSLHRAVRAAFRQAVTPKAIEIWGSWEEV